MVKLLEVQDQGDLFVDEPAAPPASALKEVIDPPADLFGDEEPIAVPVIKTVPGTPQLAEKPKPEPLKPFKRDVAIPVSPGAREGDQPATTGQQYSQEASKAFAKGAVDIVGTALKGFAGLTTDNPRRLREVEQGLADMAKMDDRQFMDFVSRIPENMEINPVAAINYQMAARAARKGQTEKAAEYLKTARSNTNPGELQEQGLYRAGEDIKSLVAGEEFQPRPGWEQSITVQLGQAGGSMAAFVPVGLLGGPAATGILGIGAGSGESIENAEQALGTSTRDDRAGPYNAGLGTAAEEQVLKAAKLGTFPGATDAIPVEVLIQRLPQMVPGLRQVSKSPSWSKFSKAVGQIVTQMALEGGQEAGQQYLQNLISKLTLTPEKDVTDDLLQSLLIGGAVGGIAETPMAAVDAVFGGEAAPAPVSNRIAKGNLQPPPAPPAAAPPAPAPAKAIRAEDAIKLLRGAGYTREDIRAMSPEQYHQILADLQAQGAQPAEVSEETGNLKPPPGEAPMAPRVPKGAQKVPDSTSTLDISKNDWKSLLSTPQGRDEADRQAEAIIREGGKASTSLIQRKLGMGYQDAAGIIERLEKKGVISKATATGQRQILEPVSKGAPAENFAEAAPQIIDLPSGGKLVEAKAEDVFGDGTRGKPITPESGEDLDAARAQVVQPTEAQAKAGNYKKGHAKINGWDISIETPKGGKRAGVGADGQKWSVDMQDDYGQILGTKGADGEQIDAFIGQNPASQRAWIIDQKNDDGSFDEHKVIYGANSEKEALEIYERGFSDTKDRVMGVTEMDVSALDDWLAKPQTKPASGDAGPQETGKSTKQSDLYKKAKESPDKPYYSSTDKAIRKKLFIESGVNAKDAERLSTIDYDDLDAEDQALFKEPDPRRAEVEQIVADIEATGLDTAKGFAKGIRGRLEGKKPIPFKDSDVDFYKKRLGEYQAQAGAPEAEKPKETRTLADNVTDRKAFDEVMAGKHRATGVLKMAEKAYSDGVAELNAKGFTIGDSTSFSDPQAKAIVKRIMSIAGAASRVARQQWALNKGHKTVTPEKLEASIKALSETLAENEAPLAPDEHPGLVIKSLETGKETRIQPPGTHKPGTKKAPEPAAEEDETGEGHLTEEEAAEWQKNYEADKAARQKLEDDGTPMPKRWQGASYDTLEHYAKGFDIDTEGKSKQALAKELEAQGAKPRQGGSIISNTIDAKDVGPLLEGTIGGISINDVLWDKFKAAITAHPEQIRDRGYENDPDDRGWRFDVNLTDFPKKGETASLEIANYGRNGVVVSNVHSRGKMGTASWMGGVAQQKNTQLFMREFIKRFPPPKQEAKPAPSPYTPEEEARRKDATERARAAHKEYQEKHQPRIETDSLPDPKRPQAVEWAEIHTLEIDGKWVMSYGYQLPRIGRGGLPSIDGERFDSKAEAQAAGAREILDSMDFAEKSGEPHPKKQIEAIRKWAGQFIKPEREEVDSESGVEPELTKEGPWDFNDTYPAPDAERLAALTNERPSPFEDETNPEEVSALIEDSLNELQMFHLDLLMGEEALRKLDKGIKPPKKMSSEAYRKKIRDEMLKANEGILGTEGALQDVFSDDAVSAMLDNAKARADQEWSQTDKGVEADRPGPSEREPAADPRTPADDKDHDPLVVAFRDRLLDPDGGFATITEARAFAAERGFVKADDADNKTLEEKIELAVVLAARDIVAATRARGRSVQLAYDRLVDLYKRQPKLGTRTSKSMAEQAYSTPAPIAFLASRLAGVASAETVFEPTAGNGMLLMEADPATMKVVANEIDATRAENLKFQGFQVTQQDAAKGNQPKIIRSEYRGADSIIMNPPFGAVMSEKGDSTVYKVGDWETTRIDYAIALHNLSALHIDGEAVLILGGPSKQALGTPDAQKEFYRAKAQREFYYRLYEAYGVMDHFTIRGELYARQGAGWPIDVIHISGKSSSGRALPGVTPPQIYDSFEALKEKLDGQAFEQSVPDRGRSQPSGTPDRGEPEPEAGDGRSPEPDGGSGDPAVSAGPRQPVPVRTERGGGEPGIRGDSGPAPRGDDAEPQSGGIDRAVDQPRGAEPSPPRLATEPASGESALQRRYQPSAKSAKSLGMLVPANMQTATQDALAAIGEDVDSFVARNLGYREDDLGKHFAAEQLDAIALAIKEYQRGGALIIGDQTGAGKGRVVAALIRYALIQGQVPVFVTEKPDLYGDMFRDMNDIGLPTHLKRPVGIFATNAGAVIPLDDEAVEWKGEFDEARKTGDKTPPRRGTFLKTGTPETVKKIMFDASEEGVPGYDVVFTTYDQTNTVKGSDTERRAFLRKMMPNAFLILDEAHNAGGGDQGWDSDKGPKNRADFIREIVDAAKGVMYSSATYAKRPDVMDLYRRTDMAKAVKNIDDLGETIAKGGVPLQQVTAAMLAQQGQYIRRERSFEGIEYALTEVDVDREVYDNFSEALRTVQRFDLMARLEIKDVMNEILAEQGLAISKDPSVGVAGASQTGFSSVMHNLVNQMLLAIKVDGTVKEAVEILKRGEKVTIALANTMESFIDDYADTNGIKVGDEIDLNFTAALKRYLDRSLRVTVKNHDKTTTRIQVPLERMSLATQRAYAAAKEIIENSGIDSLPISPIDALHDGLRKAGFKGREITGRKRVIDYSGKKPVLRARDPAEMGSAGKRVSVKSFNDGKADYLIFNRSGSTGISMHAGPKFKDQRKRWMLVQQAEGNIDTHMQTLGRTNRTGQVVLPGYKQIAAKIPAEARPAAVLLRKMASLNASTTASRKGALNDESIVDFINQYGDQVVAELMMEHSELHAAMMEPLGEFAPEQIVNAAAKVTGKMTLLKLDEQEMLLDAITRNYNSLIAQLDATGENMLEAKNLDLQARPLQIKEMKPRTGDSAFEDGIYAEWTSVKSDGKAYSGTDLVAALADEIGESNVTTENRLERWNDISAKMKARHDLNIVKDSASSYARESIAAVKDPEARERQTEKLRDNYRRFYGLHALLQPGSIITLKGKDGGADQNAVVFWVKRNGSGKNPAGLGSWEVKMALPSSYRTLTIPFSQLFTEAFPMPEGSKGIAVEVPPSGLASDEVRRKVLETYDDAARSGREDRWIFTGNLLGGFEMVGKGQIINYSTDDGRTRQGVLMPKGWDMVDFVKTRPIEFGKPEQVVAFLEQAKEKFLTARDGLVDLVVEPYGRRVEIAASRAVGGKYFLHPSVRKATEDRLTKAGSKVRWQTQNAPMFLDAVKALMTAGARFETHHEQELAQSIISPPKGPPEGPGGGGGEFRPAQMGAPAQAAPVFYSSLLDAVQNSKQAKASGRQWMGMLRNAQGVKKEEIDWLGLEEWLERSGEAPVTRGDLADFIAKNQIVIEEVDKSGAAVDADFYFGGWQESDIYDDGDPDGVTASENIQNIRVSIQGIEHRFVAVYDRDERTTRVVTIEGEEAFTLGRQNRTPDEPQLERNLRNYLEDQGFQFDSDTEFASYTLPGGDKGYHELLLTLPKPSLTEQGFSAEKRAEYARLESLGYGGRNNAQAARFAQLSEERHRASFEGDKSAYTSPHWNEKNVLAHIRFNERWQADPNGPSIKLKDGSAVPFGNGAPTGKRGTKVLFIEEIQSDWHQQGRRQGYVSPNVQKQITLLNVEWEALQKERIDFLASKPDITEAELAQAERMAARQRDIVDETNRLHDSARYGVPDAPFKTSWPELAMKRMIRWAADNGFDRIAWTPGEVQADRYDLSKRISKIDLQPNRSFNEVLNYTLTAYAKDGNKELIKTTVKNQAEAADHIGKEAAEKLFTGENLERMNAGIHAELSGIDLKIGGEAMASFYDRELVNVANKLGKKFGAKVGKTAFSNVSMKRMWPGEMEVHSFDLTPEMRQSVTEKGQTVFDRANDSRWGAFVEASRLDQLTAKHVAEVKAMAERMLGHRIKVELVSESEMQPGSIGEYSAKNRTIYLLAGAALSDRFTLHHEVIHAFRDAGVITAPEWGVLARYVKENIIPTPEWQERLIEWKQYKEWGLSEADLQELMLEEAVAETFVEFMNRRGRHPVTGIARTIMEKLRLFLERLRAFLQGAGFRAAYDIYGDIAEGRMRGRPMLPPGATGRSWGIKPQGDLRPAQPPLRRRMPPARVTRRTFIEPDDDPISVLMNRNLPLLTRVSGGMSNAFLPVRKAVQDRMTHWKRIEQAIEQQRGPLNPAEKVYQAETLMPGRVGERLEDFRLDDLDPLVEEMNKLDVTKEELDEYLYANHAEERNDYIATINPRFPDGGSGMMTADAQRILANARPEVVQVAQRVYRILAETRQRLLREGIIDQNTYNQWTKQYRFYVPLKGFEADPEEGAGLATGKRHDSRAKVSQEALGRSSRADSPMAYVIAGAQQAIILAEKARVGRTALAMARRYPNTNLWEVNQVVTRRYISKATGLVTSTPDNQKRVLADNVLAVRVGGNLYWVTLHHQGLAAGLRGLDAPTVNMIFRAMINFNRYLALVRTGWNPGFFIPNFLRDVQTAGYHLAGEQGARIAAKVARDLPAAMRGSWQGSRGNLNSQWAQHYRDFAQAGGKVGTWENIDIEVIKKKVSRSLRRLQPGVHNRFILGAIWAREAMEGVNGAIENAVRLSTYVNLRREGFSQDEAAFVAKELTVNFNRKGEWSTIINSMYLFANASVQGTTRVAQALARSKVVRRVAFGLFLSGILLDFINSALSGAGDDDDGEDAYDAIPEHIRERNFVFMTPGADQPIKIPMPWVYNVFHYAGVNFGRYLRGKVKGMEAAANVGSATAQAANPVQSYSWLQMFMPTIADPWVDLYVNEDWKGDPIMPDVASYDETPPPDSQRYFNSVSPVYREATDYLNSISGGDKVRPGAIDVSPESVEYITDFLFGGVKQTVDQIATSIEKVAMGEPVDWTKVPLARTVYGGNSPQTGRDEYYDMRNAIALTKEQFDQAVKDKDAEKIAMVRRDYPADLKAAPLFDEFDKRLKALRAASRKATDSEDLKRIRKNMDDIQAKARKAYRKLLEETGQ